MLNNRVDYDYEVANIQQYIKVIENLEFKRPINNHMPILYHGQTTDDKIKNKNCIFQQPVTTPDKVNKKLFKRQTDMVEKLEWFRYELVQDSIHIKPEQFLAYAYHQGIETNLIEVTKDPLMALFYALDSKESESGYVYIYHQPIANVTALFENTDEISILHILLTDDPATIDYILHLTFGAKLGREDSHKKLIIKYCQAYYQLRSNSQTALINNKITDQKLQEIIKEIAKTETSDHLKQKLQKPKRRIDELVYYQIAIRGLLRLILKKSSKRFPIQKIDTLSIYKSTLDFRKGLNKENFYIYQNYLLNRNSELMSLETIIPKTIIKINNKNNILHALNKFNINRNSIYGNYISVNETFLG